MMWHIRNKLLCVNILLRTFKVGLIYWLLLFWLVYAHVMKLPNSWNKARSYQFFTESCRRWSLDNFFFSVVPNSFELKNSCCTKYCYDCLLLIDLTFNCLVLWDRFCTSLTSYFIPGPCGVARWLRTTGLGACSVYHSVAVIHTDYCTANLGNCTWSWCCVTEVLLEHTLRA